ncbi:MAG: hypothetical protein JSS53_04935 [Proteobacteria bacterium]|nr:hypothetical protein [Pseudomonadota bacterium]
MKKVSCALAALCGIFISPNIFAEQKRDFQCEVWVARNTCWKDFNVSVHLLDYSNLKTIATIEFPKVTDNKPQESDFFVKKEFDCNSVDVITFKSNFSPAIWKGTDKETYSGRRVWSVPAKIKKKMVWHVDACFSDDFVGVPTPIRGQKDCRCIYPEVPPKK